MIEIQQIENKCLKAKEPLDTAFVKVNLKPFGFIRKENLIIYGNVSYLVRVRITIWDTDAGTKLSDKKWKSPAKDSSKNSYWIVQRIGQRSLDVEFSKSKVHKNVELHESAI